MEIKLSVLQLSYLEHICRKGFGGYPKPIKDLDKMVDMGLLTFKIGGPFDEIIYRPTVQGYRYLRDLMQ